MLTIFTTPEEKRRVMLSVKSNAKIGVAVCIIIIAVLLIAFRFAIYAVQDLTGSSFYNSMSRHAKETLWGIAAFIIIFGVFGLWFKFPVIPKSKKNKFEAWAHYRGILYNFIIFMPTKYCVPMECLEYKRPDLNEADIKTKQEILRSEYEVREFFKDEYKVAQFLDGKSKCNCIVPAEVKSVKILSKDKKGIKLMLWGSTEQFISSDITNYDYLSEIIKELEINSQEVT